MRIGEGDQWNRTDAISRLRKGEKESYLKHPTQTFHFLFTLSSLSSPNTSTNLLTPRPFVVVPSGRRTRTLPSAWAFFCAAAKVVDEDDGAGGRWPVRRIRAGREEGRTREGVVVVVVVVEEEGVGRRKMGLILFKFEEAREMNQSGLGRG